MMVTLLEQLSDDKLLQRGDAASFETLFYRHYDRVYGLLFRLVGTRAEAEDLAQEVFVRLHQRPPRHHDNISAWLYTVATNLGYNAIRGRKRRWQRDTLLVAVQNEGANPERQAVVNEEVAAVRHTLAQLPERDVQLLLLRQMGLSYAELADACHLTPASVGKMLARAAARFRRLYEGD